MAAKIGTGSAQASARTSRSDAAGVAAMAAGYSQMQGTPAPSVGGRKSVEAQRLAGSGAAARAGSEGARSVQFSGNRDEIAIDSNGVPINNGTPSASVNVYSPGGSASVNAFQNNPGHSARPSAFNPARHSQAAVAAN